MQWFGILNALGTFSMLSHVYFIGASSLFIMASGFVTKKSNLFFAFSYFMVSICCSVLLLIPILLGTGLQAGMQAAHSSQTIHWRDYLNNINEYSSFITGISWGLYFLLGLMLLMFVKEGKRLLIPFLFTLSIASIMFIIPAVTHVFPPPRAFGFLVLIPIIVFGLSLYFVYIKSKWIAMLSTIVMAAFFSERAHTHPFLNWSKQLDKEVEHVSEVMIKNNIHAAFNDCRDFDYFIPGISYYYMQSHENIQFTSSAKNSTRHTDSIPSNTEAIIVSKMSNQKPSKDFSLLYSIGDVLIYKRNN
ncbi:MAG: hypothetical protein IPI46_12685 [Bacteroidetes bacterium]|nr:hypothetical protein [Bacteroidota bacterium]